MMNKYDVAVIGGGHGRFDVRLLSMESGFENCYEGKQR